MHLFWPCLSIHHQILEVAEVFLNPHNRKWEEKLCYQTNAQIGSNVIINFEPKSAIVFDGETDNAIESKYIKLN